MRMPSCLSLIKVNVFSVRHCHRPDILMFQHLLSNKISLVVCDLSFNFQTMQMNVGYRVQVPEFRLHTSAQFVLQEHLADAHRVKKKRNMCFGVYELLSHEKPEPQSTTICDHRTSCSFKFERRGLCQRDTCNMQSRSPW